VVFDADRHTDWQTESTTLISTPWTAKPSARYAQTVVNVFSSLLGGVAQWLAAFVARTKLTDVGPG